MSHARSGLVALAAILPLALCPPAAAESRELNLHVDLGAALPIAGANGPQRTDNVVPVGPVGAFSLDWQIVAPLALEALVGGGFIIGDDLYTGDDGTPYFNVALGVRVRPLDNREGYALNGGDWLGNLWISSHLGLHFYDGPQFGIDLGIGYEFSVIDPVQLGVFARGTLLVEGDNSGVDGLLTIGISASFELGGEVDALDRDGDGLSDEREINRYGTDPADPDTDHDGLGDGLEVDTGTNPIAADTDGDSASDGSEDRDHDGVADPDEADPRNPDTDHGGVNDGYELQNSMDPRDAADDDADNDGVLQDVDQCPDTATGAEVDGRGCVLIRERLVLRGVSFAYDSPDILPESEQTLQIAVQALRDNPEIRVEIGGHTDNQGGRAYNLDLSRRRAESVRQYVADRGIDASRMTTRGYGFDNPVDSNDTEEGRRANRRIEFTVIE